MKCIYAVLIFAYLSFASESDRACIQTNCDILLTECNNDGYCKSALTKLADACNDSEKCKDFNFVKNSICSNQDFCANQINKINACFTEQCLKPEPQSNVKVDQFDKCFEEKCKDQKEKCTKNAHCAFVLQNEWDLIQKSEVLDYSYIKTGVCVDDAECAELVISSAKCLFEECNIEECVKNHCDTPFKTCTANDGCHKALKLARSGYCDNIDCFDNSVQSNHLCNNNTECVQQFNDIATCYRTNCYENRKFVPESEKCIAESGARGYLDEYGNCCAELSRVDCLWELEKSRCAWFYNNGEGYCYGWKSLGTCAEFKQQNSNVGPVSCFFEGDCFNDYCNQEIEICQKTEHCGQRLHDYIHSNANKNTTDLCNQSEECVKNFGNILKCVKNNCENPEPPATTQNTDATNTATTTNVPDTTESNTNTNPVTTDIETTNTATASSTDATNTASATETTSNADVAQKEHKSFVKKKSIA